MFYYTVKHVWKTLQLLHIGITVNFSCNYIQIKTSQVELVTIVTDLKEDIAIFF